MKKLLCAGSGEPVVRLASPRPEETRAGLCPVCSREWPETGNITGLHYTDAILAWGQWQATAVRASGAVMVFGLQARSRRAALEAAATRLPSFAVVSVTVLPWPAARRGRRQDG